jgi:hypothetical protein
MPNVKAVVQLIAVILVKLALIEVVKLPTVTVSQDTMITMDLLLTVNHVLKLVWNVPLLKLVLPV